MVIGLYPTVIERGSGGIIVELTEGTKMRMR